VPVEREPILPNPAMLGRGYFGTENMPRCELTAGTAGWGGRSGGFVEAMLQTPTAKYLDYSLWSPPASSRSPQGAGEPLHTEPATAQEREKLFALTRRYRYT